MSVLGQPQHEWDDFLKEGGKPRRRWPLARILWIAVPAVIIGAAVIYYYATWTQ